MVRLPDYIQHRAALRRIAIEDAVQILRGQRVGQGLRALPIGDPDKGVVGHDKVDAGGGELTRQPAVAVAVELKAKGTPSRHTQIDEAELGIHEVEIVVKALSAVRAQEGPVRLLVVPRLIAVAHLHRRDDVHQARMRPARRQNLGHDIFLTDIVLRDVLNRNAGRGGQRCRRLAHPVAQRRGKLRGIIKDPDTARLEYFGHPLGEARSRQRAGDDNAVVARQNPGEPIMVPIRQKRRHVPLHPAASCYLPSLAPASPA